MDRWQGKAVYHAAKKVFLAGKRVAISAVHAVYNHVMGVLFSMRHSDVLEALQHAGQRSYDRKFHGHKMATPRQALKVANHLTALINHGHPIRPHGKLRGEANFGYDSHVRTHGWWQAAEKKIGHQGGIFSKYASKKFLIDYISEIHDSIIRQFMIAHGMVKHGHVVRYPTMHQVQQSMGIAAVIAVRAYAATHHLNVQAVANRVLGEIPSARRDLERLFPTVVG